MQLKGRYHAIELRDNWELKQFFMSRAKIIATACCRQANWELFVPLSEFIYNLDSYSNNRYNTRYDNNNIFYFCYRKDKRH